jgi:hypothetical protein
MMLFVCMVPLTHAIISGLTFQPCARIFSFSGFFYFYFFGLDGMVDVCVMCLCISIMCMERSGVGIKGPI